jgi:hypothetical protein
MENQEQQEQVETTKKFIFTLKDKEKGIDVGFDSFENQEPMSSVDASMIILALTQTLVDSGLQLQDVDEFLGNIGNAVKELYTKGGIDLTETVEEINVKTEAQASKTEG